MPLTVTFDHEQTRLSFDRTWVSANGDLLRGSLDGAPYSGSGFSVINNTLFLEPYFFHDAWVTSSAGNYVKLASADVTFTTSAKWEERSDQGSRGAWLAVKDTADSDSFLTNTTWSKNRGFILSWFNYSAVSGAVATHQAGWSNTAGGTDDVWVEFYSNGTCQVYKGGATDEDKVGGLISLGSPGREGGGPATQQFMEVMMLPSRHRELLILTSNGSGGAVEFLDIDPLAASPTITGAKKFWVQSLVGGAQFQLAPVKFPASGYAHTQQLSFHTAPKTGAVLENYAQAAWPGGTEAFQVWGHPAYSGTQGVDVVPYETDGATAFVPDDTLKDCRLRITMTTSDTGYTPFIYGAMVSYPPETDVTDNSEEYEAEAQYIASVSLSVPDDATGVAADLAIMNIIGLESNVAAVRTQCNRPIALDLDTGVRLLDGRGSPPEESVSSYDDTGRATIEVRDAMKAFERHYFRDPIPLDGYNFKDALEFLAAYACTATITVSDSTFVIAEDPMPDANEWGEQVEFGETASEAFSRLIGKYAANWIWGIRPLPTGSDFYALSPDDLLAEASALTLYPSAADGVADGGMVSGTPAELKEGAIRSLQLSSNEPEATEVRVTGQDPRTGRPFQSFKVDYAAQTVTTAPSSRPDNWVGEIRPYGAAYAELHTENDTDQAVGALFDRLTSAERLGEFRSTLLVYPSGHAWENYPLWRGAKLRIYGYGYFQIVAFGCRFLTEATEIVFRDATYTVKKVAEEPP